MLYGTLLYNANIFPRSLNTSKAHSTLLLFLLLSLQLFLQFFQLLFLRLFFGLTVHRIYVCVPGIVLQ